MCRRGQFSASLTLGCSEFSRRMKNVSFLRRRPVLFGQQGPRDGHVGPAVLGIPAANDLRPGALGTVRERVGHFAFSLTYGMRRCIPVTQRYRLDVKILG